MFVTLDGAKKRIAFKQGTVSQLLRSLKIPREEALVKCNGALVPDDAEMGAKDRAEIIRVVFAASNPSAKR